jgi:hypothetical protein
MYTFDKNLKTLCQEINGKWILHTQGASPTPLKVRAKNSKYVEFENDLFLHTKHQFIIYENKFYPCYSF